MSKFYLSYLNINKDVADEIAAEFKKVNIDFERDEWNEPRASFYEKFESAPGPILFLVSDNFLKDQSMKDALSFTQVSAVNSNLIPIAIDGKKWDEESGVFESMPTKFQRVSNVIRYMNFWQDNFLDLRSKSGQIDAKDQDDYDASVEEVKTIASEIGEFLRNLREMEYLDYNKVKEDSYEPLFDKLNLKEGGTYTNFLAAAAVVAPAAIIMDKLTDSKEHLEEMASDVTELESPLEGIKESVENGLHGKIEGIKENVADAIPDLEEVKESLPYLEGIKESLPDVEGLKESLPDLGGIKESLPDLEIPSVDLPEIEIPEIEAPSVRDFFPNEAVNIGNGISDLGADAKEELIDLVGQGINIEGTEEIELSEQAVLDKLKNKLEKVEEEIEEEVPVEEIVSTIPVLTDEESLRLEMERDIALIRNKEIEEEEDILEEVENDLEGLIDEDAGMVEEEVASAEMSVEEVVENDPNEMISELEGIDSEEIINEMIEESTSVEEVDESVLAAIPGMDILEEKAEEVKEQTIEEGVPTRVVKKKKEKALLERLLDYSSRKEEPTVDNSLMEVANDAVEEVVESVEETKAEPKEEIIEESVEKEVIEDLKLEEVIEASEAEIESQISIEEIVEEDPTKTIEEEVDEMIADDIFQEIEETPKAEEATILAEAEEEKIEVAAIVPIVKKKKKKSGQHSKFAIKVLEKLLKKARKKALDGNVPGAVALYETYLEEDPKNTKVRVEFVKLLFEKSENREEIPYHLEKVIKADPKNREAHYHLARLAESKGDIDSARLYFEKLTKLDKKDSEVYVRLAELHCNHLADYKGASKYLKKAVELNEDNAEAFLLYAQLLLKSNRNRKAKKNYLMACGLDPALKSKNRDKEFNIGNLKKKSRNLK